MSLLTALFSPLNLLFLIIVIGFAVSKIQIKGISIGIAGILFVAIAFGFLTKLILPGENPEIISNALSSMNAFSKLGSSLFVSIIGLQTGFSIKENSKNSLVAFAIGSLMSISGFIITLLLSIIDKTISYSSLLGILCGALTSTPGLSSVCELLINGCDEAVCGYGCSYLPGVILTVLFTRCFSKRNIDANNISQTKLGKNIQSKVSTEFMLIFFTAFLGNLVCSAKISFLNISLGATASTLLSGLLIGYIVCKRPLFQLISHDCLKIFKTFGLALFFAGTGFSSGIQTVSLSIKAVLYGAIITISALFCGFILYKLIGKKYGLHQGLIIAGGMTSSPAYSVIEPESTTNINSFSFAYFGGLISLILIIQFIV